MRPAIQNMLRAVALMLLIVFVLTAWGCKVSKSSEQEKTSKVFHAIADSSAKLIEKERKANTDQARHTVERDSVGVVPGGEAEIELTPEEVEPVTDVAGFLTGRTFTKREGQMTATVVVNAKGGIKVRCKEDSLRLVIFRYRMDSIASVQRYDSLLVQTAFSDHSEITDSVGVSVEKESVVRSGGGFGRWVMFILGLIIGVIVGFILKMIF